jgi:ubiquinone/menaquinone biosynthesis C-methylase UbiE
LIAAAQAYPTIPKLIGIDISEDMINFARKQAEIHKVSERVEFHVMDALQMLKFSTDYFDLVNQRFGQAYLRKWDWRQILSEYRRVIKPEGTLRITEIDISAESTSAAEMRFQHLMREAMYQAGHLFERDTPGLTNELVPLFKQTGLKKIQTQVYNLDYRADTLEGKRFYEDIKLGAETMIPFIRKWTRLPADYDTLRQQIDREMQQPDFVSRINMLTVSGTK